MDPSTPKTSGSGAPPDGNSCQDLLVDPANKALMIKFLRSIDSTKSFFRGP